MGSLENSRMVDNMDDDDHLSTQIAERALRLVDRGIFVHPHWHNLQNVAYADQPFRTTGLSPGQIHISAPTIYPTVIEMLDLRKGQSFLNVGSGSGYLSTLAGFFLGANGRNHGVELYSNVIDHALSSIHIFFGQKFVSGYDWCIPEFVHGNAFELKDISKRYDRIYVGAQVEQNQFSLFSEMLKEGGIMIIPVKDERHTLFQRVTRTPEGFDAEDFMNVAFAELIHPDETEYRPEHIKEALRRKRKLVEDPTNPNESVTEDLLALFKPRSLEVIATNVIRRLVADNLRRTHPIAIQQKQRSKIGLERVAANTIQRHEERQQLQQRMFWGGGHLGMLFGGPAFDLDEPAPDFMLEYEERRRAQRERIDAALRANREEGHVYLNLQRMEERSEAEFNAQIRSNLGANSIREETPAPAEDDSTFMDELQREIEERAALDERRTESAEEERREASTSGIDATTVPLDPYRPIPSLGISSADLMNYSPEVIAALRAEGDKRDRLLAADGPSEGPDSPGTPPETGVRQIRLISAEDGPSEEAESPPSPLEFQPHVRNFQFIGTPEDPYAGLPPRSPPPELRDPVARAQNEIVMAFWRREVIEAHEREEERERLEAERREQEEEERRRREEEGPMEPEKVAPKRVEVITEEDEDDAAIEDLKDGIAAEDVERMEEGDAPIFEPTEEVDSIVREVKKEETMEDEEETPIAKGSPVAKAEVVDDEEENDDKMEVDHGATPRIEDGIEPIVEEPDDEKTVKKEIKENDEIDYERIDPIDKEAHEKKEMKEDEAMEEHEAPTEPIVEEARDDEEEEEREVYGFPGGPQFIRVRDGVDPFANRQMAGNEWTYPPREFPEEHERMRREYAAERIRENAREEDDREREERREYLRRMMRSAARRLERGEDSDGEDEYAFPPMTFNRFAEMQDEVNADHKRRRTCKFCQRRNCGGKCRQVPRLAKLAAKITGRHPSYYCMMSKKSPSLVRLGRLGADQKIEVESFGDQMPGVLEEPIGEMYPNGRYAIEDWVAVQRKQQFEDEVNTHKALVRALGTLQFEQEQGNFKELRKIADSSLIDKLNYKNQEESIRRFERALADVVDQLPIPSLAVNALKWNLYKNS